MGLLNIYEHEQNVMLDGTKMDVSKRWTAKVDQINLPDRTWRVLARKSKLQNIKVMDMDTSFKVTMLAQVKNEAALIKDKADRFTNGRANIELGTKFIEFEGQLKDVYAHKKGYLRLQTEDQSIDGKVLDELVADRVSTATSMEVKKRQSFFKAYAAALGTVPTKYMGTPWQKAHYEGATGVVATDEEKFKFVANTGATDADKLTAVTAAAAKGMRVIDLNSFTEAKKRGEAIYNWIHKLVIYAKRLGSTHETTHPLITDGLFNFKCAMDHQAQMDLKKFITGGQPLPTITLEGQELEALKVQDVSVPIIALEEGLKTTAAVTGGNAKGIVAVMQGSGENAPVEFLEAGSEIDETVSAPEALESTRDRLWNFKSKISGNINALTEIMFGLVA